MTILEDIDSLRVFAAEQPSPTGAYIQTQPESVQLALQALGRVFAPTDHGEAVRTIAPEVARAELAAQPLPRDLWDRVVEPLLSMAGKSPTATLVDERNDAHKRIEALEHYLVIVEQGIRVRSADRDIVRNVCQAIRAHFPDLDYCTSAGRDLSNATADALEARNILQRATDNTDEQSLVALATQLELDLTAEHERAEMLANSAEIDTLRSLTEERQALAEQLASFKEYARDVVTNYCSCRRRRSADDNVPIHYIHSEVVNLARQLPDKKLFSAVSALPPTTAEDRQGLGADRRTLNLLREAAGHPSDDDLLDMVKRGLSQIWRLAAAILPDGAAPQEWRSVVTVALNAVAAMDRLCVGTGRDPTDAGWNQLVEDCITAYRRMNLDSPAAPAEEQPTEASPFSEELEALQCAAGFPTYEDGKPALIAWQELVERKLAMLLEMAGGRGAVSADVQPDDFADLAAEIARALTLEQVELIRQWRVSAGVPVLGKDIHDALLTLAIKRLTTGGAGVFMRKTAELLEALIVDPALPEQQSPSRIKRTRE